MENNEEKRYALVNSNDFFNTFEKPLGLVKDEYMFITKAFYEKDSVVAIYEEEGAKDCYFQLPEYRSKLVPHSRRFIYFLPKNTFRDVFKSCAPDGRHNIEIHNLIQVADPYTDGDKVLETQQKVQKTEEKPLNIYSQLVNLSKFELATVITSATNELLTRKE